MIFSKQFATMVKAGLPILNVLGMLRDQIEHPELKIIVEDIRKSSDTKKVTPKPPKNKTIEKKGEKEKK